MIDALWLALRAAGFVLLLHSAGAALFLVLFARELPARVAAAIRVTAFQVTLAAGLCVGVQALLEPAHLAGEWAGVNDAALWRLTFLAPGAWVFWLRLAGLTVLAWVLWRPGAALGSLALPASLTALGSFLVNGHALLDPHRLLLAPLLALHVLTVAFWFGALWPLRQLARLEPPEVTAAVLRSFSARALWLVPLLGGAGVGLAYGLLPDLAALRRPYGATLCLKTLLFAGLLGLAARNKLALTPQLAHGQADAVPRLRRMLALEYLLICAVLTATAVMTGLWSPTEGAAGS